MQVKPFAIAISNEQLEDLGPEPEQSSLDCG